MVCPSRRRPTAASHGEGAHRGCGGGGVPHNHRLMARVIDSIELVAAVFVGLVAADIFVSVLLRYFFSVSIPDSYDFGRLLLGILIFWGIAAPSYRGAQITVDLVWGAVGKRQ